MEFLELFRLLDERKVRYLICGGLAVSIYGIQRTTADIDLLVDFDKENLTNFLSAMKLLSYVGALPFSLEILANEQERKGLIEKKNLIAYSFYNSRKNTFLIDVLIKVPFSFQELWEKRTERSFGTTIINIVGITDLIELKKIAGREQDEKDVLLLSKFINDGK
jgi:hypothetical protein